MRAFFFTSLSLLIALPAAADTKRKAIDCSIAPFKLDMAVSKERCLQFDTQRAASNSFTSVVSWRTHNGTYTTENNDTVWLFRQYGDTYTFFQPESEPRAYGKRVLPKRFGSTSNWSESFGATLGSGNVKTQTFTYTDDAGKAFNCAAFLRGSEPQYGGYRKVAAGYICGAGETRQSLLAKMNQLQIK